jgi:hypothetical protein
MTMQLTLDSTILENLLKHAASAARHVGSIEERVDGALAVGPLADHIDAIVHELGELLGDPHLIGERVPNPDELVIAFADDESTQPHVRLRHGRRCLSVVRPRRPVSGRQRRRSEKVLTTSGTEQVQDRSEPRWVRPAIATAVIALIGVIASLVLGACGVTTDAVSIHGARIDLGSGTSTGGAPTFASNVIATEEH